MDAADLEAAIEPGASLLVDTSVALAYLAGSEPTSQLAEQLFDAFVSTELVVRHLVLARSMPGRPIPDALIVASAVAANAESLATFDRDQARYGIPIRQP